MLMLQTISLLFSLIKLLSELINLFFLVFNNFCKFFYVLFLPHSRIFGWLSISFQLLLFSKFTIRVYLTVSRIFIVCVYILSWFYKFSHLVTVKYFLLFFRFSLWLFLLYLSWTKVWFFLDIHDIFDPKRRNIIVWLDFNELMKEFTWSFMIWKISKHRFIFRITRLANILDIHAINVS